MRGSLWQRLSFDWWTSAESCRHRPILASQEQLALRGLSLHPCMYDLPNVAIRSQSVYFYCHENIEEIVTSRMFNIFENIFHQRILTSRFVAPKRSSVRVIWHTYWLLCNLQSHENGYVPILSCFILELSTFWKDILGKEEIFRSAKTIGIVMIPSNRQTYSRVCSGKPRRNPLVNLSAKASP